MALPANLATNDIIDETWCDAVTNELTAHVITAWTLVNTFANGWVAYGVGYEPQYRKNGDNVEIRGLMKDGAAGTAFTLPAGFRPTMEQTFVVFATNVFGGLSVNTAGVVSILAPTPTGAGKFVYLSAMIFSTLA